MHSYSVGFQRSIGRDMALEVRYVGNRNLNTWAEENWNERTIFENGFLDEFKLAQANLAINARRRASAASPTPALPGTSPLPIHLAYLTRPDGRGQHGRVRRVDATSPTPAFLNRFSLLSPTCGDAIGALDATAFRANALTAGSGAQLLGA